MRFRLLVLLLFFVSSGIGAVAPASIKAPKPLLAQVQHLTELLRDSYAVWYTDATMVQFIKLREDQELALVVFTVEGFGGGNSHTQYLAAFSPETNRNGKQHFSLVDVMPIAGKGWRSISNLNAKVTRNHKSNVALIAIDALEVTGDDSPNFPSKKITINLLLKDGRLVERK